MSYIQLYIGHLKRGRTNRMDTGDCGGALLGDFRTAPLVGLAVGEILKQEAKTQRVVVSTVR